MTLQHHSPAYKHKTSQSVSLYINLVATFAFYTTDAIFVYALRSVVYLIPRCMTD